MPHSRPLVIPALVVVALSSAGCYSGNTLIGPSAVDSSSTGPSFVSALSGSGGLADSRARDPFVAELVLIQPAVISGQPVGSPPCSVASPFLTPFNVVFLSSGQTGLFLSQVQMQFADSSGGLRGPVTIPQPDLTQRFGSVALPSSGTLTFPFAFPFGCAPLPGTLTVVVVVDDASGHHHEVTRHVRVQ